MNNQIKMSEVHIRVRNDVIERYPDLQVRLVKHPNTLGLIAQNKIINWATDIAVAAVYEERQRTEQLIAECVNTARAFCLMVVLLFSMALIIAYLVQIPAPAPQPVGTLDPIFRR